MIEKIFKALSCSHRIEILKILSEGEACQCEIAEKIPVDVTTLSRHIKILKDVGLISERREGTKKFLSLKSKKVLEVLRVAEELLKEVKKDAL